MGTITPLEEYDLLEFNGQKFAVGVGTDQFVGTSFARWCELFGIPEGRRDIAREHFDQVTKAVMQDNTASGVTLELVRRTAPKVAPLYAWEIARRAMGKMYDFLKRESTNAINTDEERAALRRCWQGVHHMELQIDAWVKSLMRGEVVSVRHPAHKPSGSIVLIQEMVAALARHDEQIIAHGEAIKQLQDPLLPLRRLMQPITAREAVRAMGIDNEATIREGSGQTTEQAFGVILSKRWRGPGKPERRSQRMAAERFSVERSVPAYPLEHVIECWPEFFSLLSPNAINF